jgi:hypothetical protein
MLSDNRLPAGRDGDVLHDDALLPAFENAGITIRKAAGAEMDLLQTHACRQARVQFGETVREIVWTRKQRVDIPATHGRVHVQCWQREGKAGRLITERMLNSL